MELILIYLWLKLSAIQVALNTGVVVFAIACVASFVIAMIRKHDYDDAGGSAFWLKRRTLFLWLFVPTMTLSVFWPTPKDVAILVGAHVGLSVAKSPEAQKAWTLIRGKANEILDQAIQDQLKEVK